MIARIRRPTTSNSDQLPYELAAFNARRLRPCAPDDGDVHDARLLAEEARFIADERAQVTASAATAPLDAAGFLRWFNALEHSGPGQGDPLFPWLARTATLQEMRWFLSQEAAGEAGFDDLLALTQVKLPTRAKLELARNYWDEMGRGNADGMHGRLLDRLVCSLALPVSSDTTVAPALALGNLMVGLATRRAYAYHSLGALGVFEMTASGRVAQVSAGLQRLGISAADRRYFDLHAVLDRKHSVAWNNEVFATLVEDEPMTARWIAEGALMRLNAGARCFAAYRSALDVAG